jgi:hypothetical protein
MSTTLSHFANVKSLTLGSVSIGSTSNLSIEQMSERVEGSDNNTIGGAVSSHIIGSGYKVSFDSRDFSAINATTVITFRRAQNTLTAVAVAAETQAGTPLANQLLTVTNLVVDSITINPATKGPASFKVRCHTMAAASDADQFTMAVAP